MKQKKEKKSWRQETHSLALFFVMYPAKNHKQRVVNKYYSDLGMWNRRYKHEILFLLLSLCWWSLATSLVCVIAKFFIFYSLQELLCAHSSYADALHLFPTLPNRCDLWAPSTFCLCLVQASNEYETYNHQLCTEINE